MLLLLERSPLRRVLRELAKSRDIPVALGRPGDDALFERALGCDTIVYAPASSLLSGTLEPRPDPGRMRRVIGAAHAPGCSLIVLVVPAAGTYDTELDVLRRSGKPYVVVTAPPLIEELSAEIAKTDAAALWLPRTGNIDVGRAVDLAETVLEASRAENHGGVTAAPSRKADLATLFREAAAESPKPVRVVPVWPPLHRAIRPIARWLRGSEPSVLTLAARLEAPFNESC